MGFTAILSVAITVYDLANDVPTALAITFLIFLTPLPSALLATFLYSRASMPSQVKEITSRLIGQRLLKPPEALAIGHVEEHCSNCGAALSTNAKYCSECGKQTTNQYEESLGKNG